MSETLDFSVIIPARLHSTRLPEKLLLPVAGKPLLAHTVAAAQASGAQEVIVATDAKSLADIAEQAGARAVMTRDDHRSGTDRLAECADIMGWSESRILVNLQGDEPLMPSSALRHVADLLAADNSAAMATLCVHMPAHERDNPNAVKVVADGQGRALYFSRACIPFPREAHGGEGPWRRHLGLYAYRRGFLPRFVACEPPAMEQLESLEQLRALWLGERILLGELEQAPPAGIDTRADYEALCEYLQGSDS